MGSNSVIFSFASLLSRGQLLMNLLPFGVDPILRGLHCLGKQTGPGCSKLTTSLVYVSLKFQTLISEIRQYFLLKKYEKLLHCKSFSHFFNKNISVFDYKVVKHLTS